MQKYQTVENFLVDQPDDKQQQIESLRSIILKTAPQLTEHIKWNAPSYMLDGEDRITFNLLNKEGLVKLVFHMGATRKEDKKAKPVMHDTSGLMEWSSDIRGMVTVTSLEDIAQKRAQLQSVISQWLAVPSID